MLVTLPALDWKDEKTAWVTALAEAGAALKLNAPPPLAELPAWIAGALQRQGQGRRQEALAFIAERVEGNLLAAQQEIRKLGLLHPEKQLTLAEVREAVLDVARFDLDSLREALLAGDAAPTDPHARRPASGRRGAAAGTVGDDRGSARAGDPQRHG